MCYRLVECDIDIFYFDKKHTFFICKIHFFIDTGHICVNPTPPIPLISATKLSCVLV